MVLQAIVWTVLAWVAGAAGRHLSLQPAGFLPGVLLPILAMGLCILREIRKNGQSESEENCPQALPAGSFLLACGHIGELFA